MSSPSRHSFSLYGPVPFGFSVQFFGFAWICFWSTRNAVGYVSLYRKYGFAASIVIATVLSSITFSPLIDVARPRDTSFAPTMSPRKFSAVTEPVSGFSARSKEYFTSSATTSRPSWNVAFLLM